MRTPRLVGISAFIALVVGGTASAALGGQVGTARRPGLAAAGLARSAVTRCSTATAKAPVLHRVRTALEKVPGFPFGVVTSPDGRWSFVALSGSVGVFRTSKQGLPKLARTVSVPGGSAGEALTSDGRYLLVAAGGAGAVVLDARNAEHGGKAFLGTLTSPGFGSIEVALSRDNRFAFVSVEYSDEIAVYDLARALAHGFGKADFVGDIPLGLATVGTAVSPDGRWLYATSEVAKTHGPRDVGTLSVISVVTAERHPARSVVATVLAGCEPVRVVTSSDGTTIWVTARASDALLGFSAALLRSHPAHALVANVRVGEAPVGLALVRNGTRIVIADSNRFLMKGQVASLAVVSVPAARAGHRALVGYLRAGGFPREMALETGGRILLVSNFSSRQLEAVTLARLP